MRMILKMILGNIFILSIVFAWSINGSAETVKGEVKQFAEEAQLFTLQADNGSLELISWDNNTVTRGLPNLATVKVGEYFIIDYFLRGGQMIASTITVPETALPQGVEEASLGLLDSFVEKRTSGQVLTIIDVRSSAKFDAGHIPGAISIPLTRIEKKTAGLLTPDKNAQLVFYDDGTDTDAAAKAAERTAKLGYKKVMLYKEGVRGWVKSGRLPASSSTFIRKNKPIVVDIRSSDKVHEGHIEGAVNIELKDLERKRDVFPPDRKVPLVVYGERDEESVSGAAVIRKWGYANVTFLQGGVAEWVHKAEPLEIGPASELISNVAFNHSGQLTPDDFKQAINSPQTVEIVDVRGAADYQKGHLQSGVHMPLQQIAQRHDMLSKDKIQVVFAADPVHAEIAYDYLKSKGHRVNYLRGSVLFGSNGEYRITQGN